ncbi:phosphatase PAP2 family protein [Candidatus Daviesbacteria bacterium]|nr:phosphatase PAP2 family protein [Candidatus Daviesbacteria bacterium]
MLTKKFLLFLSILLFITFILFSYLVAKEKFTQIDFDTTVKFQDKIARRLDGPLSIFSLVGMAEITGFIWFILIIFLLLKKHFLSAFSFGLFLLGLIIELFGKLFVHHPSPPFLFYRGVFDFEFPSNFVHTDYSYPSGHVYRATFLLTFLFLYFYFRFKSPYKYFFLSTFTLLFFGMIVSRIYLGEHWTTDVVGGALLGTSLGIVPLLFIPLKTKVTEVA